MFVNKSEPYYRGRSGITCYDIKVHGSDETEQEAEDKGIKYADSLEYTIPKFSDEEGYCWSQVEQAYEKGALDFAKPRDKRITELEEENGKAKKIISELCGTIRFLNRNDNTKLTNVDVSLEEAEDFIK